MTRNHVARLPPRMDRTYRLKEQVDSWVLHMPEYLER